MAVTAAVPFRFSRFLDPAVHSVPFFRVQAAPWTSDSVFFGLSGPAVRSVPFFRVQAAPWTSDSVFFWLRSPAVPFRSVFPGSERPPSISVFFRKAAV